MLNAELVQARITALWPKRARCMPVIVRLARIRDRLATTDFVSENDARFIFELDTDDGLGREATRSGQSMSRH